MPYQSTNPYTGKVEKTFDDISPAQLEEKLQLRLVRRRHDGVSSLHKFPVAAINAQGGVLARSKFEVSARVQKNAVEIDANIPDKCQLRTHAA